MFVCYFYWKKKCTHFISCTFYNTQNCVIVLFYLTINYGFCCFLMIGKYLGILKIFTWLGKSSKFLTISIFLETKFLLRAPCLILNLVIHIKRICIIFYFYWFKVSNVYSAHSYFKFLPQQWKFSNFMNMTKIVQTNKVWEYKF